MKHNKKDVKKGYPANDFNATSGVTDIRPSTSTPNASSPQPIPPNSQNQIQSSQMSPQQSSLAKGAQRVRIPISANITSKSKVDIMSDLRKVNESYPLISTNFNGQIYHLSYARIYYNPQVHQVEYFVVEPEINDYTKQIIARTKDELHEKLDIDFNQINAKNEVYDYINKKVDEIWAGIGLNLPITDMLKAKYYIFRDTIGLNKIEPLMQDPNIEDIGCDGVNLPIFIFHRNPLYGEITTNIKYSTKEELDSFAMKLAQKSGRTVSVASPLMDGTLPDGSRVQITYGTDIARKGSNFTIRKFFKVPLTPIDLMNFGTIDAVALAYLWLAIEKERSILISGTTATGKTTMLNAISLFIPPTAKIVSIEDTAELRLTHTNWIPQITRSSFGGKEKYGEVSMYTLLKSALRQRPDYLIVGEVRGIEASVLFQAMATGHPSLSTLHADTVTAVIHRLTTRPIDLPTALLENLDAIVFLEKAKSGGKLKRRVSKIIEIEGFDYHTNQLLQNEILSWDPKTDVFTAGNSSLLHDIAERQGISDKDIQSEIGRRVAILNWMRDNRIYKFEDVSKIVRMYYADPNQLETLMSTAPQSPQAGISGGQQNQ